MVRAAAANLRQGGAIATVRTVDRAPGDVDRAAVAAEKADQLQAEYFLRLLGQSRRHVDHRIEEYHKAIASAEANGNTEGVCGLRRISSIEEQERETLTGLIANLHRRFPGRPAPEVPVIPRRPRLTVR